MKTTVLNVPINLSMKKTTKRPINLSMKKSALNVPINISTKKTALSVPSTYQ
jgi:hypothetical protein